MATLSCIYATIIFFILRLIGQLRPKSWLGNVAQRKFNLWFSLEIIISVGLFIFMFTYWGNHGLGDTAIVPVGHFQIVTKRDSEFPFIVNKNGDRVDIKLFTFDNDNLYAETQNRDNETTGNYVVWNLKNDEMQFYKTKENYITESKRSTYLQPDKFLDFWVIYEKHWGTWKRYLLP